jgi:hypothetical protein
MKYSGGHVERHLFVRSPGDEQCLACHHGNFVGWDFYGRYELDYPGDFTAGFVKGRLVKRPYGLEWHEMTPDIHKKAGFRCVKCHVTDICGTGGSLSENSPSCTGCHMRRGFDEGLPGHDERARSLVDCSVCHAVWSFNDYGRSLLRQDDPDWSDWLHVASQGSSEVERLVETNGMRDDGFELPAFMTDKFMPAPDGQGLVEMPGVWFAGFSKRRWAPVTIGETCGGRLSVIRPVLDISVSYLDSDDEVLFDNLAPGRPGGCVDLKGVARIVYPEPVAADRPPFWLWRAYVPHTTGPADIYRTLAVMKWLVEREGRTSGEGMPSVP